MKKISELGITGKKLLIEGIAFLIAGVLLLSTDQASQN